MKKSILLLFILFKFSETTVATHVWGADIGYTCQGNGSYRITYTLYRDCLGITSPTSFQLEVDNTCGTSNTTHTMNIVSITEITPACPGVVTTCNGGSAIGIQKCIYETVITLPDTCSQWRFGVTASARSNGIGTFDDPSSYNLYVEASLNNTIDCDTSAIFSNDPIITTCVNQPYCIDPGVFDIEGDSVVASFVVPRSDRNIVVPYAPNYSLQFPLPVNTPLQINQFDGTFCFTPTSIFFGNYAIEIVTYRNGIIAGKVMRDVNIYTVNCAGQPMISGINGTAVTDTFVCVNSTLCFDINTNGFNLSDSTFISWDSNIPNASFLTQNGQNELANFCWTPTGNDALQPQPFCFTANVIDNNCPTRQTNSKTFCITVYDSIACLTADVGSLIYAQYDFSIYPQPARDVINVKVNSNEGLSFYITNLIGKKVIEKILLTANEVSVPTAQLDAGYYFVCLVDKNDKIVACRKSTVIK